MHVTHRMKQRGHLPLTRSDDSWVRMSAAATPNAAVKSRYFFPSASHTWTPFARFQTIGQEPSDSMNVTLRDS